MKGIVIIPTYNEAKNISSIVERVFESAPDVYVMVVDDSSPDGTAQVVKELSAKNSHVGLLLRKNKEGLGRAYLHAFSKVIEDPSFEYLVMMDADHSHDPQYLRPMVAKLLGGSDVVIGSRYCRGGGMEGWEFWRRALSVCANMYCRLVTGLPVNDTTAGYNMIRTDALRKVALASLDMSGYAFQIELKYTLWRSGARVVEVPIIFHRRREGESKLSSHIIREGILAPWKMLLKRSPVPSAQKSREHTYGKKESIESHGAPSAGRSL